MVLYVTRVIHSDSERRSAAEEVEKRVIALYQAKGCGVQSRGEILDFQGIDHAALTGRENISLEERGEDGVRRRISAEKEDAIAWNVEDILDDGCLELDHAIVLKSISLFYDSARGVESLNIEFWYLEKKTGGLSEDRVQRARGGECTLCSVL